MSRRTSFGQHTQLAIQIEIGILRATLAVTFYCEFHVNVLICQLKDKYNDWQLNNHNHVHICNIELMY